MMVVPNYILQSQIHGIGLFAKEFIPKDALLWVFDTRVDRNYTVDEYNALPETIKDYCKIYGYFCPVAKCYQVEVDNGRFTNHSYTPNTYFSPCMNYMYAKFDIQKDEEITSDYREFDTQWPEYAHLFGPEPIVTQSGEIIDISTPANIGVFIPDAATITAAQNPHIQSGEQPRNGHPHITKQGQAKARH